MAQLKAGSTAGGVAIATDAPAIIPVDNLTAPGGPLVNGFIGVKDGALIIDTEANLTKPGGFGLQEAWVAGGNPNTNVIQKFPFLSPFTTATDEGDLGASINSSGGMNSRTHGFVERTPGVDMFPFTAPFTTATDEGNLSQARDDVGGASSQSNGYAMGGSATPAYDTIDSFPFSAPWTTATDEGNLSQARRGRHGSSSYTAGWFSGGETQAAPPRPFTNRIDSFPFDAPFVTATDEGNTPAIWCVHATHSSDTDGWVSGGITGPTPALTLGILKWPFSAPFVNATSVGSIHPVSQGNWASGGSSDTLGYHNGGYKGPNPAPTRNLDAISSFPFSAPPVSAVDEGNLFEAKFENATCNY